MINKKIIACSIASLLSFNACELVDPTEVVNPNLTEEAVLGTQGIMNSWLAGMQRQLALVTNELVVLAELGSDNYENVQTFYNQNLDVLTIRPTDADVIDLQFTIARLREMADYGLEVVAPADEATTDEQLAALHFYKAYAYMLSGEYFSFLPIEPQGEPVADDDILQLAIDEYQMVIEMVPITSEFHKAALMGLARTNYKLGNKAEAVAASQALLAADPDFLFLVEFDQAQGPVNVLQTALYDRGNFDDLQVLPRLDFLDPKYYFRGASEASPIPAFKAEEAYLIIAEAAVSDQNLLVAKEALLELLDLVDVRPVETFSNTQQGRTQRNPGSRPNDDDILVAARPGAPLRAGLVLDRTTPVSVPTISGTSVIAEMILAASTEEALLELIYLMRQEIFIGEARRLSDLGIQFVIGETEFLANPNIEPTDPGVTPVIPPFFAEISADLDAFTYDAAAGTAVILYDLNEILVENRDSPFVLPFY